MALSMQRQQVSPPDRDSLNFRLITMTPYFRLSDFNLKILLLEFNQDMR